MAEPQVSDITTVAHALGLAGKRLIQYLDDEEEKLDLDVLGSALGFVERALDLLGVVLDMDEIEDPWEEARDDPS